MDIGLSFPFELVKSEIFSEILIFTIYILIVCWLVGRYTHRIRVILDCNNLIQLSIRGFAVGSTLGIITYFFMICAAVFFLGTGVSLGVMPQEALAGGNGIVTVFSFIIGLTVVSLCLSFYLKKIDQLLRGSTYKEEE